MPGFEARHKMSDGAADRLRRPVRERPLFLASFSQKSYHLRRRHPHESSRREPTFKDAILWLWTAKSVKIWRITHAELAMPFGDEFAVNIEEEFNAPILGRASFVCACHWSLADCRLSLAGRLLMRRQTGGGQ